MSDSDNEKTTQETAPVKPRRRTLVRLARGLCIFVVIILAIGILFAGLNLFRQLNDRAQAAAQRAERDEILVGTATALAAPEVNWSRPAGEIVLVAQGGEDDPTPTLQPIAQPTLPPTLTLAPIAAPTLPPTATRAAEATSAPVVEPSPTVVYVQPPTKVRPTIQGLMQDYPAPAVPPPTAIPTRMPMADNQGEDIINILLMGLDTHPDREGSRSDSIIVASINRTQGTVNLLSVPRDLYVYIPGWTMQRINTALPRGGVQLVRDTLLYNLGIPIHFYARVDFEGFSQIIDTVGGVDIAVDCTHQDWILKEPGLDQTVEENWELFTLPMGVQHLDGHTALWYARSRRRTSDYDRSRRQQMILRALFHQAQELGLLTQVPVLWEQISPYLDTDMTLADILGMVPVATQLDSSKIQSLVFNQWYLQDWTTPDGDRVLLPVPERVGIMVTEFYQSPTRHQLVQEQARIEILNATDNPDWDIVAADRLAWEGFVPVAGGQVDERLEDTVIYDYTGQVKGSSINTIAEALNVNATNFVIEPDPDRKVDFRVVLGASYNSCTYNVPDPVATPAP